MRPVTKKKSLNYRCVDNFALCIGTSIIPAHTNHLGVHSHDESDWISLVKAAFTQEVIPTYLPGKVTNLDVAENPPIFCFAL